MTTPIRSVPLFPLLTEHSYALYQTISHCERLFLLHGFCFYSSSNFKLNIINTRVAQSDTHTHTPVNVHINKRHARAIFCFLLRVISFEDSNCK
jgi:hypothetical protein